MNGIENNITYEEAVKIGIREGIKYIKEQEYKRTQKRYDRRLRNTRLLLKHYRSLNAHSKMASYSISKVEQEKAVDVLDDIESIDDEEQYIQSISRTKIRTLIIIKHINKVLKYYEAICNTEGKNKKRKYQVIRMLYIDDTKEDVAPTYEKVAEKLEISPKTVSRDVWLALEDLSILLFGIDGIKL